MCKRISVSRAISIFLLWAQTHATGLQYVLYAFWIINYYRMLKWFYYFVSFRCWPFKRRPFIRKSANSWFAQIQCMEVIFTTCFLSLYLSLSRYTAKEIAISTIWGRQVLPTKWIFCYYCLYQRFLPGIVYILIMSKATRWIRSAMWYFTHDFTNYSLT